MYNVLPITRTSPHIRLCKEFDISQFNHLVGWARNAMLMMAMVDYPYPAEFMGKLPAWPVSMHFELEYFFFVIGIRPLEMTQKAIRQSQSKTV